MYFTILVLFLFITPALVMLRQMNQDRPPYKAMLDGVIGAALVAVMIFILSALSGQSLAQQLAANMESMTGIFSQNQGLMNALGIADLSLAEQGKFLSTFYGAAVNSLPGTILIWASIIAYFEYMVISKTMNRKGQKVLPMPELRYFNMPRTALFGFVVIFILSWVATVLGIVPRGLLTGNVNIIFEFVFSVQGLGVLFFFLYSKRMPRIVTVALGIFLMATGIGQMMLFLVGLTDFVFNLREKISPNLHLR